MISANSLLTTDEAAAGLKEALHLGSVNAVTKAGKTDAILEIRPLKFQCRTS
jgi:hypothetical protein